MCYACGFRSNRPGRGFCYRCAASKAESFGASNGGQKLVGPGATVAASAASTPPAANGVAIHTPSPPSPSTSTSSSSSSAAAAASSADAAKAIRARIQSLEAARVALASCTGCIAECERLDHDIAAAKASLSAYLPVEVAVKGTLGTAIIARAAVTKAEGRVAKLETQIAALVELYDAASAELESSRAKLADAEAATAKAASVALPPEHYWSAVSSDPGPFWSAFKAVISQRCPGLPQGLVGQLDAATKAFEAALTPIFVQPTAANIGAGQQPGAGPPVAAIVSPVLASNGGGNPHGADGVAQNDPAGGSGNGAGALSGLVNPVLAPRGLREPRELPMQDQGNPTAAQQAEAAAAAAQQQAEQLLQQQAQKQQIQLQQQQAAAATAAAAAEAALAQQQTDQARQQQAQQQQLQLQQQQAATAAAAAANAAAEAASGVPVDGAGNDASVDHELVDVAGSGNATNDPMGGGAADGVANKRGIEAVSTAKSIAAKAKARSAP